MNYVDFTLVRLATPATRDALIDDDGLVAIVNAAYGGATASLVGPFQAVFDELELGVSVVPRTTVDGYWQTGSARAEGRLEVAGIGRDSAIRVDAMWRGAIIARAAPANAHIGNVVSAWPDLGGIDEEIIAALGSLPTDGTVLEAERRKRVLARIRATMQQPAAFTDARFDAWLRDANVGSVGELLAARGTVSPATLVVSYSDPAEVETSPRPLPVSAAILVRDAPISLADMLVQSKVVVEHLSEAGLDRAPDPELGVRPRMVAVWIVPETVFDDTDWPGGTTGPPADRRLDRRRNAAVWLAPEGIAIVSTAKHP